MITLKTGVKGYGEKGTLRPEGWRIIEAAEKVYAEIHQECVVTSICDGEHSSKNSLHHFGNAVDLRTRHLTEKEKAIVTVNLKDELGADYDVVLEPDHIHAEYDPKR